MLLAPQPSWAHSVAARESGREDGPSPIRAEVRWSDTPCETGCQRGSLPVAIESVLACERFGLVGWPCRRRGSEEAARLLVPDLAAGRGGSRGQRTLMSADLPTPSRAARRAFGRVSSRTPVWRAAFPVLRRHLEMHQSATVSVAGAQSRCRRGVARAAYADFVPLNDVLRGIHAPG
jgi:hypothetical protein